MRRVLFVAALFAVLAACSLKTPEGAACSDIGGVGQCPEGQRCGADGACSFAANECGEICTSSSCSGPAGDETLSRCDRGGVCASLTTVPCGAHETCNAGAGRCDCAESVECPAQGTSCLSGTRLRTCDVEGVCPFFVGDRDCNAGEDCVGTFPTAQCRCPDPGDGLDQGCSQAGLEKCDGLAMHTCRERAPGSTCLTWQLVKTCSNGLVCRPGQDGACVCPDHQESPPVLLVDPDAVPFDGAEPNGTDPMACRYGTLADALLDAKAGEIVKATALTFPVTFPGEAATVPAGVSLVADEATQNDPTQVIFLVEGTGTTGLTVEAGGSASGLTVRKAAGAAATVGIDITGASSAGVPSLADVRIDKVADSEAFETGIRVSGGGVVAMERVRVEAATSAGLLVRRAAPTDGVTVTGGVFTANGEGVRLVVGDLTLASPTITQNGLNGINSSPASGPDTDRSLTVSDGLVAHNGANGLFLVAHARLDLQRNRICSNTGADRTLAGTTRKVGGVYCQGNAPPQLSFKGNRIQDNGGDQLFVGASATSWDISGVSGCVESTTNVLTGLTAPGVGLVAVGAPVTAKYFAWSTNVGPVLNTDYRAISSTVDVGGASEFCFPPTTPIDCPP